MVIVRRLDGAKNVCLYLNLAPTSKLYASDYDVEPHEHEHVLLIFGT